MNEKQELMKEVWNQVAAAREKYVVPLDQNIPPFNRQKEMVACTLLIEAMEDQGADRDDMMQVLIYCGIVLDADKMHLDVLKAYDDYKIDAMCEKYIKEDKE